MASQTKIEWVTNSDGSQGQTWNFLRGCRRVSEGCTNCYAERQAIRHAGPGGPYEGLVKSTPRGPRWTGEVSFHEEILLVPLKRKKPTTYFVNSMSDLFYEKVSDEILDKAFAVMALTPQHTYQILTKRPERMLEYTQSLQQYEYPISQYWVGDWVSMGFDRVSYQALENIYINKPLPNVWLGVSCEDQKTANERIPLLLQTPAAVRWISAEPLLGPIDLTHIEFPNQLGNMECWHALDRLEEYGSNGDPVLDWVVVGGESGPGARPCDIAWIRSIIGQCKAADVPVFTKQLGASPFEPERYRIVGDAGLYLNNRKGGDPSEWPADLRVRQMPEVIR